MSIVYLTILMLIALSAAIYAQWRIPFHTATARHTLITRLILLTVGVAFGTVVAATYTNTQGWLAVLAFLTGLGLVHVPAAAILFLKRRRAQS